MNILALDTSMGACSAALLRESGGATALVAREAQMARGHAEALMPMLEALMDEARGLAVATNARLWGTDSLTVMAQSMLADRGAPFAICIDAHRGMLYFGLFDGDGLRLEGPLFLIPKDAAAKIYPHMRAFGSGAAILAEAANNIGIEIEPSRPDLQPDAANLALLALQANSTFPTLRPLYLRPPDAKPQSASGVARR